MALYKSHIIIIIIYYYYYINITVIIINVCLTKVSSVHGLVTSAGVEIGWPCGPCCSGKRERSYDWLFVQI